MSDDLRQEAVEQIARKGYAYTNEVKALAAEVLRRRAEANKPQPSYGVPIDWSLTP
jgi:hypothetical protein